MTAKKPTAGQKIVAEIVAEMAGSGLQPDSKDAAALQVIQETGDLIERLEKQLAKAGDTYTDREGVVRPSPLASEIRQHRLVLLRATNAVVLTPTTAAPKNAAKQRGAAASWKARQAQYGAAGLRGMVPLESH